MTGANIVCFAKDWSEDPTSANHVMRQLARDNRVLWVNSIATRTPSLSNGRDLRRIGRKLAGFARGAVNVLPGLSVFTPLVLPFPHSRAATFVNERILGASLAYLRRSLGMDDFQLWTFLPTALPYAGRLGENLLIYYCTDEWSGFRGLDSARVSAMERELCERADVVFVTSRSLLERRRAWNRETHLASHGVDHAHFARALDPETEEAPELAGLPRPVFGFFGLIESWIDLDLIAHLARARPAASVVLIGKSNVDLAPLERLPNVHLLGRKAYEELPRYAKGFDVGLCPFVASDLAKNVNPVKLREYLSAGLPVVASGIPEAAAYPGLCFTADDPEAFVAACDVAAADGAPEVRRARSEAMRGETWEALVARITRTVQATRRAAAR